MPVVHRLAGPCPSLPCQMALMGAKGKTRAAELGQPSKTEGGALPGPLRKVEEKPTAPVGELGFGHRGEAHANTLQNAEDTQEKRASVYESGRGQIVSVRQPEGMRPVWEVAWVRIPTGPSSGVTAVTMMCTDHRCGPGVRAKGADVKPAATGGVYSTFSLSFALSRPESSFSSLGISMRWFIHQPISQRKKRRHQTTQGGTMYFHL